jgi:hypothetical protein
MRLWANRQERRFEALLDRIELIAREDLGVPAPAKTAARPAEARPVEPKRTVTETGPGGRLGLDALDDEPGESERGAAGRRTRA